MLLRQELAFLDHLMRVLSGTPQGGYSPTGWLGTPHPSPSWTRGPDVRLHLHRARDRAARPDRAAAGARPHGPQHHEREHARLHAADRVARDDRACRSRPDLLGTGVTVTGYQRIRDTFLDVQLRAQTMLQGSAQATQDGLGQVESVLNEPSDTGLNSLLGTYWSAWQNVANAPEDMATRQALVEAATSLANGLNNIASQLATIQAQTSQDVQLTLQQINADGQTLQSLNTAI